MSIPNLADLSVEQLEEVRAKLENVHTEIHELLNAVVSVLKQKEELAHAKGGEK